MPTKQLEKSIKENKNDGLDTTKILESKDLKEKTLKDKGLKMTKDTHDTPTLEGELITEPIENFESPNEFVSVDEVITTEDTSKAKQRNAKEGERLVKDLSKDEQELMEAADRHQDFKTNLMERQAHMMLHQEIIKKEKKRKKSFGHKRKLKEAMKKKKQDEMKGWR